MPKNDKGKKEVERTLKADPELASVFKRINQLGKPKAAPATGGEDFTPLLKPRPPQVIKERKDPELIRDDPLPQPIGEKPEPRAQGDRLGPTPAGKITPPAAPPQPVMAAAAPDAQLVQLVKLYQQLDERDQRELFFIAMMKVQLSKVTA